MHFDVMQNAVAFFCVFRRTSPVIVSLRWQLCRLILSGSAMTHDGDRVNGMSKFYARTRA